MPNESLLYRAARALMPSTAAQVAAERRAKLIQTITTPPAAAVGALAPRFEIGQPTFPEASVTSAILKGYVYNELIYSAVGLIVKTFAQGLARVRKTEKDGETISDHPAAKLIAKPTKVWRNTAYELWEWSLIDWLTTGNCFWEIAEDALGRPAEIWRLDPTKVRIVPDKDRVVAGYLYDVGGQLYPIPPDAVIHFAFFDPRQRYLGLSPLVATMRAIAVDNEQTNWIKACLENGAMPSVAIESEAPIRDEEHAEEIRRKFKARYGGQNRGDVGVLQKGMTVKQVGLNMEQLAMPELRSISETRVLMALGGAPLVYLLGTYAGMRRAIYNNYSEAREALVEEIIAPLWNRIDDKLTSQLLPLFDNPAGLEFFFDTTDVAAYEDRRMNRIAKATDAFARGLLRRNEARKLAGYEPDDQDSILIPANVEEILVDENGERVEPETTPDSEPDLPEVSADGSPMPPAPAKPGTTPVQEPNNPEVPS